MLINSHDSFKFSKEEILVDVRSPEEFEADHICGAINLPVLNDSEFEQVGKLYKQNSPFEASKVGSALVASNIARHLEKFFSDKRRESKIVFYCARGGKRSQSFATVCKMVGWEPSVLKGGYKAYRKHVLSTIQKFADSKQFVILGGRTGVGKTDVLEFMKSQGHAVLNLEKLANHRGSILGAPPTRKQPKQKLFESTIYEQIINIGSCNPIFLESESSKIGNLLIPPEIWHSMKRSPTLIIDNTLENRVDYILENYDPDFLLEEELPKLISVIERKHPNINVEELNQLIAKKNWRSLVSLLITDYYDPLYTHSIKRRLDQTISCIKTIKPIKDSFSDLTREIILSLNKHLGQTKI